MNDISKIINEKNFKSYDEIIKKISKKFCLKFSKRKGKCKSITS